MKIKNYFVGSSLDSAPPRRCTIRRSNPRDTPPVPSSPSARSRRPVAHGSKPARSRPLTSFQGSWIHLEKAASQALPFFSTATLSLQQGANMRPLIVAGTFLVLLAGLGVSAVVGDGA